MGVDKDKTIEALEKELNKLRTQKYNAVEKSKAEEKKKMIAMKEAEKYKSKLNVAVNNPEEVKKVYLERIKYTKSRILQEIKRDVEYKFTLDKMTPEELNKYAKTQINKIAKGMKLKGNLFKDIGKDQKFINKLFQQYRDRAEETRERNQGQNQNRGRGM